MLAYILSNAKSKSKSRNLVNRYISTTYEVWNLVGDIEFESTTSSMSRKRSNQLS